MGLSKVHQELLNELYPDGYEQEIRVITLPDGREFDEHDFYHVLFVKIIRVGERTVDTGVVQKFDNKSWDQMERLMNRSFFNLKATTGYSEMAVIHDPKVWKKAAEAKAEADAKKAAAVERAANARKVAADKKAAADAKKEEVKV